MPARKPDNARPSRRSARGTPEARGEGLLSNPLAAAVIGAVVGALITVLIGAYSQRRSEHRIEAREEKLALREVDFELGANTEQINGLLQMGRTPDFFAPTDKPLWLQTQAWAKNQDVLATNLSDVLWIDAKRSYTNIGIAHQALVKLKPSQRLPGFPNLILTPEHLYSRERAEGVAAKQRANREVLPSSGDTRSVTSPSAVRPPGLGDPPLGSRRQARTRSRRTVLDGGHVVGPSLGGLRDGVGL
jgi:hypothetical protein